MNPEHMNKLSINLGFMEAQAVGAFAITALVLVVVLLVGRTLWRR